jgi:hypothetical protein
MNDDLNRSTRQEDLNTKTSSLLFQARRRRPSIEQDQGQGQGIEDTWIPVVSLSFVPGTTVASMPDVFDVVVAVEKEKAKAKAKVQGEGKQKESDRSSSTTEPWTAVSRMDVRWRLPNRDTWQHWLT